MKKECWELESVSSASVCLNHVAHFVLVDMARFKTRPMLCGIRKRLLEATTSACRKSPPVVVVFLIVRALAASMASFRSFPFILGPRGTLEDFGFSSGFSGALHPHALDV